MNKYQKPLGLVTFTLVCDFCLEEWEFGGTIWVLNSNIPPDEVFCSEACRDAYRDAYVSSSHFPRHLAGDGDYA